MESLKAFRWTFKAQQDLSAIVKSTKESCKDWSDISVEFRQIHPNYKGKDESLRKQYDRFKTKFDMDDFESSKQYDNSLSASQGDLIQPQENNISNDTNKGLDTASNIFRWKKQTQHDLLTVVKANEGTAKNWSNLLIKFKEVHPNYKGQIDALRMQYAKLRSSSPEKTQCTIEKFVWSEEANQDLISIVNTTPEIKFKNWPSIGFTFRQKYPNYEGGNEALKRQFYRVQKIPANRESELVYLFKWTKQQRLDLIFLVNLIQVDGYPNWTKIWYTFKRYHENYEGSKENLRNAFENFTSDDYLTCATMVEQDKLNDWDEHMDEILAEAAGHAQYVRNAQIRDGRKKNVNNIAGMAVKFFKENFKRRNGVDYIGVDAIILKHYYEYSESLIPSTCVCKDDLDSASNIDWKKLQGYASKNHTLAFTKVFNECCHNCGVMFSRGRNSTNHKMLPRAINDSAQVTRMKTNVPYTFQIDEKFITCRECIKNPDWPSDYSVVFSKSLKYYVPNELCNLNEYERNQIALCGGFYSLYQKQSDQRRIFEQRQGECNIGKKRDIDYHNMYTTYYSTERLQKTDASNAKIKKALVWLRQHNHLFKEFLANYETIYGYLMTCRNLRPEERIIQISKGNLEDMVGKDTMGLLIPADNVRIESGLSPESHHFGVQHPLQDKLNSLRGIINVNYSDPNLEAKRWPHLFPEGYGSWRRNSALKQQTYVKHRLLDIDARFRRTNEFMFFWYDRLIKERLLYFNNRQRTVNVTELMESIQVKDVRENENKYGTTVPSTISGSKTYWRARGLDLLALVRDLGKPDIFVTLTQNDNWLELQQAIGNISAEDMKILDQPIMNPAIGGKSVVSCPVETVIAFYKRLDMFMKSCVHNKNGPFGEVLDYWFRIEYQNRGALHCHMVLWICEDSIPDDVVMAQMPRYSGTDVNVKHQTFVAREYVKTFQMHTCHVGSCRKDFNAKCKYGFPYAIQLSDDINESKMGYTYKRQSIVDNNVVPYNIYALMCWNGHINVQKITPNGIEAYLCKYVSKPEKSIDIRDITSDADKFLKARIVGILECCAHLLQFNQVRSTRKVVFLPCDFQPAHRMLKRKMHLPYDNESNDIYYQTLLYKYLVRPKELHNFTYIDMYRFYDVASVKTRAYTQADTDISQDESECEIRLKCDESEYEFSSRVHKIKSQRKTYTCQGYKYTERGKAAVPRWRFLMPFGNESEKYYEQRILMNIPIMEEELNENGYPFSDDNESKTFVEECCIRGLVDSEETAKSALLGAVQRGFSVDRVLEIATLFVDQLFVTKEYVDSIIIPWVESMPVANALEEPIDMEYGEELAKMVEKRVKYEPYKTFLESMTDSQKQVMEWVGRKMEKEEQILAIISGGAGVGKSFITKALYSYFIERKMVCILLATTGSAAHLISGTTVHFYLKCDIHGNKFLQPGTISAKIVEDTDVIILDEFSMLNSDLLNQLNECTTEFGKSKHSPFGGKHLFLIGDPCQLPAINTSVFANGLLNNFSILLLKETVRQKDEAFAALLNRVRVNMMTEADKALLNTRYTNVKNIECDDETLIVTATRKKMQIYNHQFLNRVTGESIVITAEDFERDTNKVVNSLTKTKIRRFLKNLWDEQLIIKEGCIVRLLRNLDVPTGWVNSKRAKVFRVPKDGSYIILQDINDASKQLPLTKIRQPFKLGENLYYRYQYPLILGYATTVHAVQGVTVTGKYYVDLDRSFWESGQAFVALSRPKELSQLHLLNTHFEKVLLKPYYKDLMEWMKDVDEIAIMRKPRFKGDFPLIPADEQTHAKMQEFPSSPATKTTGPTTGQFRPPRQLSRLDSSNKSASICDKKESVPQINNTIESELSPRAYKLAEAFSNACRSSSQIRDKVRFGIKLMNEILEQMNSALQIRNVLDPALRVDDGQTVSPEALEEWDTKRISTLNLLRRYSAQFRAEFETLTNLVTSLDICKYSGEHLADNVLPMYRDDHKWQPISTAGDGRCFYHSVSTILIGNSTLSNSLKLLLSFVICNEYEIYDAIFSTIASSASNVVLKALSYNCWADMEIITAMSYFLRRPIIVISGLQDSLLFQERIYNPLESELDPLFIGHVKISVEFFQPNHFVAFLQDECFVQRPSTMRNHEEVVISPLSEDVVMLDSYESESDTESL